jgi:catechol 2,3-dioxygenase-like lactoylglutathione lyase family enzyme
VTLPARLGVVVIGVRDLAGTRRFYESLGWRSRPRDGLFARFELDGAALVLFPRDTLAETVGTEATDGFGGITPAMVLDSAQALDDGLKAVVAAGGRVVAEPADRPWGVRTAYFADPEDNIWELCALPS